MIDDATPVDAGALRTDEVRVPSSDGVELEGHLAVPDAEPGTPPCAVVLLHGFPSGQVWADRIGGDLPELADRAAAQTGWAAMAIRFRGCGTSTGDFGLRGWVDDVTATVDYLQRRHGRSKVWVCGFGTGGALALVAAADDPRIAGVAVAGSPADFDDWAANPNRLLAHAKRVGAITSPNFPEDLDRWRTDLRRIRAVEAAEVLPPRSLLVIHGAGDELVPHFDARLLADAHGSAELRVVHGAGHLLRHDPRVVAVLLGWLERQLSVADTG